MDQHFTAAEREELVRRLLLGESKSSIAKVLGRNRSSIFRELKRNSGGDGYRAVAAQALAEQRRRQPRRKPKMESPELRAYVEQGLSRYWSPEQIAGRSRIDFPQDRRQQVSHQTIYVWINRPEHCRWRRYLRSTAWPKSPRRSAPYATAVSIAGRPAVVAERSRFGDWEGDTLRGRLGSGGLLTLVERRSGYALLRPVRQFKSETVGRALEGALIRIPPELRRTATFDHGTEFHGYQQWGPELGLEVYFAAPYSPWQRGTNENTNGLIRQFFPKRTNFVSIYYDDVVKTQTLINERPRKRLGYRSPAEIFQPLLRAAIES